MTGLPPNLLTSLTSAADVVVDEVLLCGSLGKRARPRTEVGFVAAITLGGVPGIASAWAPLLKPHGYSLKIDGVFCHAAPVVAFKGAAGQRVSCELADLLVVTDHLDQRGRPKRRASLIQAKMASKARRVSLKGKSSVRQLDIYQSWPAFTFKETIYGSKFYVLKSVGQGDAGSFGVIDRHFRNSPGLPPRWTQHYARPTPVSITNEPSFGGFLAQMVGGKVGAHGRFATPGGSDDWSQVVDLLLDVTYKKAFRHAPTLGASATPRGVTAIAYLTRPHEQQLRGRRLAGHDWRPPFDGFEAVEDESPGGISVLRIEVSQDG